MLDTVLLSRISPRRCAGSSFKWNRLGAPRAGLRRLGGGSGQGRRFGEREAPGHTALLLPEWSREKATSPVATAFSPPFGDGPTSADGAANMETNRMCR